IHLEAVIVENSERGRARLSGFHVDAVSILGEACDALIARGGANPGPRAAECDEDPGARGARGDRVLVDLAVEDAVRELEGGVVLLAGRAGELASAEEQRETQQRSLRHGSMVAQLRGRRCAVDQPLGGVGKFSMICLNSSNENARRVSVLAFPVV